MTGSPSPNSTPTAPSPTGEYRVVLPDGEPLPEGTQVIGRGSRLHFLAKTSWYQLDVDDIPG